LDGGGERSRRASALGEQGNHEARASARGEQGDAVGCWSEDDGEWELTAEVLWDAEMVCLLLITLASDPCLRLLLICCLVCTEIGCKLKLTAILFGFGRIMA
jgi:hypothetical protein